MDSDNIDSIYSTPESEIVPPDNGVYAEHLIFSSTQRLGRVRWFFYNFLANLVGLIAGILISALLSVAVYSRVDAMDASTFSSIRYLMLSVIYIIPVMVSMVLARRRLHDMDFSGWFGLAYFVPVLNLLFFLALLLGPGTQGENRYGLPPKNEATWFTAIALGIPCVFILAVVYFFAVVYPPFTM